MSLEKKQLQSTRKGPIFTKSKSLLGNVEINRTAFLNQTTNYTHVKRKSCMKHVNLEYVICVNSVGIVQPKDLTLQVTRKIPI